MDFFQILVLALVQGLTEFLPISSSAHLILAPKLLGWEDQGLAFDVAVHIGSLAAVIFYFRKQLQTMTLDWCQSVATRQEVGESKLAWWVIIGTIPAGLAGLFLKDFIELFLRTPTIIALATIIFGLLLWYADARKSHNRSENSLTLKDVIFIGSLQALALIPGASRAGITMTAALLLGLKRDAAARFSFLLSIPIILAAGGKMSMELMNTATHIDWFAMALGVLISAVSAYACIHFFLKLLEKMSLLPFIIYRLILGIFLFVLFM